MSLLVAWYIHRSRINLKQVKLPKTKLWNFGMNVFSLHTKIAVKFWCSCRVLDSSMQKHIMGSKRWGCLCKTKLENGEVRRFRHLACIATHNVVVIEIYHFWHIWVANKKSKMNKFPLICLLQILLGNQCLGIDCNSPWRVWLGEKGELS